MKKLALLFVITSLFTSQFIAAQTTAMDFNRMDCNGNHHHLFAELDSNHVAILEFFMNNCNSCIVAGNKIKNMKTPLDAEFPNQIHSYSFAYTNSYSCATVADWVSNNGFATVPMDSGATQVAYYGGFGMPTVVVVGGTNHDVLFSTVGFSTSDTTAMASAIRDFFASVNTSAITDLPANMASFSTFPNPVANDLTVTFELKAASELSLRLTNIAGQTVAEIAPQTLSAGSHQQTVATSNLSNGVYLLSVTTNTAVFTHKIVISH